MILVYCIISVMCVGQAASSSLELFREACPYSNFCNKTSLQTFNETENNMPCCYDCFCDEHCFTFGDCCPDYEPNRARPNTAVLECKPGHVVTERTKKELLKRYIVAQLDKMNRYRMIDFCPPSYEDNSTMIEKCNGNFSVLPQLTDLVLVSDKTGRIFKNKYCAKCHGVFDVTSWSLKIEECVEDISEVQLTLSETRFFVVNYCMVTSERPRGIPVTGRMLKCPESLNCNGKGLDQKLVDACYNGPNMPYLAQNPTFALYKNVFCYKICFSRLEDGLCPNYNNIIAKVSSQSYQMLLNLRPNKPPSLQITSTCSEPDLNDHYTGKCRRVYCPPFEVISYGRCVPLYQSVTNLPLSVNVLYHLKDNDSNLSVTVPDWYNETMKTRFLQKIHRSHGYPKCKFLEISVVAYFHKISKRFEQLLLNIIFDINEDCTMSYIGDCIKQKASHHETETWLLQNRLYEMGGRFAFYKDLSWNLDKSHYRNTLLRLHSGSIRLLPLEKFFLCPYFKLSFEEYLDHVERHGKVSKEYQIRDFSPSALYLDGFYPLTYNQVVVCVDTYLPKSGKSGQGVVFLHTVYLFIFAAVALFI